MNRGKHKLKKKEKNEIFYSLCTDDIQNVAEENFGRKLTN